MDSRPSGGVRRVPLPAPNRTGGQDEEDSGGEVIEADQARVQKGRCLLVFRQWSAAKADDVQAHLGHSPFHRISAQKFVFLSAWVSWSRRERAALRGKSGCEFHMGQT